MDQNKKLGAHGESLVAEYLRDLGYVLLELNYRSRYGEIDLIVQKEQTVVFVEVKTRKTEYFPIATVVTPEKQRKIIKTAKVFLLSSNLATSEVVCRFDVATVLENVATQKIEYIENAFYGE